MTPLKVKDAPCATAPAVTAAKHLTSLRACYENLFIRLWYLKVFGIGFVHGYFEIFTPQPPGNRVMRCNDPVPLPFVCLRLVLGPYMYPYHSINPRID